MQKSISGPSVDPALVAKRKLQSGAYQLIKVFPDQCLDIMKVPNYKPSRRVSLPPPPLMGVTVPQNKKNTATLSPSTAAVLLFGPFSENPSIAAANQLSLRAKKRMPGRPQTAAAVQHSGPLDLYRLSSDLIPTAVGQQLKHLEQLTKNTLGLSAMLSSTTFQNARGAGKSASGASPVVGLSYLSTPSLCDKHAHSIVVDNDELTSAQLKYAKEELEKAERRKLLMMEKRKQLKKDSGAMRLRMMDDVNAKQRALERSRKEAQRMREENARRKKLEEEKRNGIFQRKQERIAILRGDLQRAEAKRLHVALNRERKEIDFKQMFRKNEQTQLLNQHRLKDHEKRQMKHKYTMVIKLEFPGCGCVVCFISFFR